MGGCLGGPGEGEPGHVTFEVTDKALDFLGYRALRDLLGTQGYFSPEIEVGLDEAEPTAATDARRPFLGTVTLRVEPGTPTRIAWAQIYFRGDIATSPEAAAQRTAIESSAALDEGS